MKTLLLLRHAKSSWDDHGLADFDRPLAQRGIKAAPLVGALLAARGWTPDMAVVSTAARTGQTWDLVSEALGATVETRHEEKLYMAASNVIFSVLAAIPETVSCAILVGHNPGMEDCARLLAGEGSEPEAQIRMTAKFPTGAVARFVFEGAWTNLEPGTAMLTDFITPHDLDAD